MKVQDLSINASGGATVGFIGTFLISLFRAPKLLDIDRAKEIEDLSKCNSARTPPTVSSLEQERRTFVSEKMQEFSEQEQAILKHILNHGRADRHALAAAFGYPQADEVTHKGLKHEILVRGDYPYQFRVNPTFEAAISFYFHGD